MKDNQNTSSKRSLRDSLLLVSHKLGRFAVLWFALLLVAVYGFVLYRIAAASSLQPSDADVSAQIQSTSTPHVDQSVVDQMQSLQDHSINVKTLFDAARSNPFQE